MRIIGLTGGIASGKSSVCKVLKERGITVISCDAIAREVVEQGQEGYKKVVAYFGTEILMASGEIDRDKLGSLIFDNEENRHALNRCIHAEIGKVVRKELFWHFIKGTDLVVVDIPLLYETKNLDSYFSAVIVVYCTKEQQIVRLMDRNDFSRAEAEARVKSQLSLEEKRQKGDFIIENSGLFSDTELQIRDLIPCLRSRIIPLRNILLVTFVVLLSLALFWF